MGFEKNNTLGKGRPKGSTNRTTKQMKDILVSALFGETESIEKDLQALEPYQRLQIKTKFASFILPTQKAVEVNDITIQSDESILGRLERFSDEQLEAENKKYIKEN
jgi:hypothetical protein